MIYYVVLSRVSGIYTSWIECKNVLNNDNKAEYKIFSTYNEAEKCLKNYNQLFVSVNISVTNEGTICLNISIVEAKKDIPPVVYTNIYTDGSVGRTDQKSGVSIYADGKVYYKNTTKISIDINEVELYAIFTALSIVEGNVCINTDISFND